jgi:D-aminopeptidase
VNAAIEGFISAGSDEILVVDGHGAGGIDTMILDNRVKYLRMNPGIFPFMLDETYDGIAHIGQHAKAGSECAHMAHTGWFNVLDEQVNGVSIGEFGQMTLCAADLGVPAFFASGDSAFKLEAEAFVPGIECVEVKWGTTPGSGDQCTLEEYKERNLSAIHIHPDVAYQRIKQGAYEAAMRLKEDPSSFSMPDVKSPYEITHQYRASAAGPAFTTRSSGKTMAEALNSSGEIV